MHVRPIVTGDSSTKPFRSWCYGWCAALVSIDVQSMRLLPAGRFDAPSYHQDSWGSHAPCSSFWGCRRCRCPVSSRAPCSCLWSNHWVTPMLWHLESPLDDVIRCRANHPQLTFSGSHAPCFSLWIYRGQRRPASSRSPCYVFWSHR